MCIKVLVDPLDHKVHLPLSFNKDLHNKGYMDEELSVAVLQPAMIIIIPDAIEQLYHLRSVDWGVSILLRSERKEDFWLVSECIYKPTPALIIELMIKGNFFCLPNKLK